MDSDKKEIKVLFVCMGNICRSPSGEAVMNAYIKNAGLSDRIKCDSAGTIAHHVGESADERMQEHANKRGYELTSISRQFKKADFNNFDYIITMDRDNYNDILSILPSDKVTMVTDYFTKYKSEYVPDPYYGGDSGFEKVLDMLEDACEGLLNKIKSDHNI